MPRSRNDHELRFYVDEQTFLLVSMLASREERTASAWLRRMVRRSVNETLREVSREIVPEPGDGTEDEGG